MKRVQDASTWQGRSIVFGCIFVLPFLRSRAEYDWRYREYGEQVQFLATQLDSFPPALRSGYSYDSSLIVIHGDDGSRLQFRLPGRADDAWAAAGGPTLRDEHSVLLASKLPGAAQGRANERKVGLPRRMIGVFASELVPRLSAAADYVYHLGKQGTRHSAPLIDIWNQQSRGSE